MIMQSEPNSKLCSLLNSELREWLVGMLTCIVMYVIDATVTLVILCIFALPFLVAVKGLSTEVGDVKMCLYTYNESNLTLSGLNSVSHTPYLTGSLETGPSRDHQDHICSPCT